MADNNCQVGVYVPAAGVVTPPGTSFEQVNGIIQGNLDYSKSYQKKEFKILALGVVDEIKCKDRKITFQNIEVRDDNSMVKVNNIDFKCYYNNKEIYNNTFYRDYNTNIIEINNYNGSDLSIPLNNDNNSEYRVLALKNTSNQQYGLTPITITNSFNKGEFTYEITPNNTDFGIDLSKHKIVKTLNLLKSKDSLLGNSDWVAVQDTYNQSYEYCSIIEGWVNDPSTLIKEEIIEGTKKLTVDYGVSNSDYRFISQFRDITNTETTSYNGYFYSNSNNNSYNVTIKPIDESELYNKPENTSDELFKNLKIHQLKLNINPITYRIFLDGKKREGHGETYKETEQVKIKTTYNVYNSETKEYDDTFEDIQTVPSKKMPAVVTHNAYHCYGQTEYTTIPKGIKDISKESIINTKEPIQLLNISSKLLDKAKRDDEVFAIALRKSTIGENSKTYDVTLGIDKENIKSFVTYTPHNVLKTTKDSIGSYSYYIITDANTGFTYYYLNDSDGKIVLKNEEEQKSTKLNSNTNTSNWLINYNGVTCNDVQYDQYTTFNKSYVQYYNCSENSTITIDDTVANEPKIIAFYVKLEDVEFVQCNNLIQPKDFNGNIDAENRDEIGDLESSIYRKTRLNQPNYYRIVLLKNNNGQDSDGNNIISKITFLKDMTIYNPIIYDAATITGKDETSSKEYNLCYDFRAPAMKLNYLEQHPKEIIDGHSLDKIYLPKPFYEIIN